MAPLTDSEDAEITTVEPAWIEEEQKETSTSLKEKQLRMEQQVYRIWT